MHSTAKIIQNGKQRAVEITLVTNITDEKQVQILLQRTLKAASVEEARVSFMNEAEIIKAHSELIPA